MTMHSPVALRELSGDQLFIVRLEGDQHVVRPAGVADEVQSILRTDPEAFLARSILVCEGASEIGLARGLGQCGVHHSQTSFFALGGAYVNAGGVLAAKRRFATRHERAEKMIGINLLAPGTASRVEVA